MEESHSSKKHGGNESERLDRIERELARLVEHCTAMQACVGNIESVVSQTQTTVTAIQTEVGTTTGTVTAIQTSLGTTSQTVDDIKAAVKTTSWTVDDIKAALKTTSGTVDDIKTAVAKTNGTVDDIKAGIGTIKDDLDKVKAVLGIVNPQPNTPIDTTTQAGVQAFIDRTVADLVQKEKLLSQGLSTVPSTAARALVQEQIERVKAVEQFFNDRRGIVPSDKTDARAFRNFRSEVIAARATFGLPAVPPP
jgi:archaellum component FlaC